MYNYKFFGKIYQSRIKIDVEGAEAEVLRVVSKALNRARELAIEWHSKKSLRDCKEILDECDYKLSQPSIRYGFRWFKGYILLNLRLMRSRAKPYISKKVISIGKQMATAK